MTVPEEPVTTPRPAAVRGSQTRGGAPAVSLVGESAAVLSVKEIAATVAARRSTLMIHGETGTGKEMLARFVHANSARPGPFIPVDCSALTDTLFESQLFGHVKGAFTGAIRDSLGFIRAADTGTLFLDEIGEMSLPLQAKLLRVVQERCVVPVGSTTSFPVDVRIICATHRDLPQMVRNGAFRQDLLYRLNVVALTMPPLRERPDDVLPLARHFLALQADCYDEPRKTLSPEASAALRRHTWPGNVRELANVIEHAHVLATNDIIDLQALPPSLTAVSQNTIDRPDGDLLLHEVERRTIAEAMRRARFVKAEACRLLGINRHRLNRKIRALGVRSGKGASPLPGTL